MLLLLAGAAPCVRSRASKQQQLLLLPQRLLLLLLPQRLLLLLLPQRLLLLLLPQRLLLLLLPQHLLLLLLLAACCRRCSSSGHRRHRCHWSRSIAQGRPCHHSSSSSSSRGRRSCHLRCSSSYSSYRCSLKRQ
jgi:hypothetical protein